VILSEVIKAKDIFEFDLKSFFDMVSLDYLSNKLREKEVPENIVRFLYYINSCAVSCKAPYRLNEHEHKVNKLLHSGATIDEVVDHPRPISYMYRLRGVPQGSPTSPLLASLCLEGSILDRGMDTIMYADDGLYYGDLKGKPLITPQSNMVSANVYFNMNKCR